MRLFITLISVASFTDAWIETPATQGVEITIESHLLQMRGLKLDSGNSSVISLKSHLLQMRGLKLLSRPPDPEDQGRIFYRCVDWNLACKPCCQIKKVASFTDAWIETQIYPATFADFRVASFTDAWIETRETWLINVISDVASFTDAWIETINDFRNVNAYQVASFTDAWIETLGSQAGLATCLSHLLQMRGLKLFLWQYLIQHIRRIFYRCVDWNSITNNPYPDTTGRIFYRCVDWNSMGM